MIFAPEWIEEDTASASTVIQTRDDVRWLKQAVQALLDRAGVGLHLA